MHDSDGEGDPRWTSLMERRVQRREPGVPWHLGYKKVLHEFAAQNRFPTSRILQFTRSPGDLDFARLPDRCVVKPEGESSGRGVMALTRQGDDLWFDDLHGLSLRSTEIIERLAAVRTSGQEDPAAGYLAEERISDIGRYPVPRDLKFYTISGDVALVLVIDRNTSPASVEWFDGEFRPLTTEQIDINHRFCRPVHHGRPPQYRNLLGFAQEVSAKTPTPFASIDCYNTPAGPRLGEITLTPGGLYFGQHYKLSEDLDRLLGQRWVAADPLSAEESLTAYRRDYLRKNADNWSWSHLS